MSNIFEPITGSALSQIKVRQTKISQQNRSNEIISWLNSNGAFVRLKSSVDVDSPELRTQLGYSDDQPWEIASRYTLQGGIFPGQTYKREGLEVDVFPIKSGILGSTSAPAYGYEGTSITGLKPMPGIEKVSVKTVGEGYLREATINLRANSPEQLNILDVLYFRPGYSVLLEWGHTSYFNNNENFIPKPSIEINLSRGKKKSDILTEIEQNREISSYNYDALFGVVSNFDWSLRDDGGYDVTLKIISTGDIVDSLKVSATPLIKDLNQSEEPAEDNISTFEKDILKSKLHSFLIPILYYSGNLNLKGSFISRLIGWATNNIFFIAKGTDIGTGFFKKEDIISGSKIKLSNNKNIIPNLIGYKLNLPQYNFPITPEIKNNQEYSEVLVYGGVDGDIKIGGRTKEEFRDKDYTPTEYGSYIKLGLLFDVINNLFIYGSNNEKLIELETDLNSSKCLIHPYSISPDPNICLYYNDRLIIGNKNILPKLTDQKFIEDTYNGNLLRIHVNIKYILNTFEKNLDENGDLSLKPFLKNLLQGINSCLGGLNDFKIITQIDKNGKEKLKIISLYNNLSEYTPSSFYNPKDPNNKILEIFGNKTLFHNISLSSELTNEISSIVSISAQADNYQTNSEGGDAFAYLNKGIKDRIIPKKIIKNEPPVENPTELSNPIYNTSQTFTSEQEESIKNNQIKTPKTTSETSRKGNLELYKEYLQTLYTSIPKNQLPKTSLTLSSAKSTLKDLIKDELSTNTQTAGKSTIIPINLSFTMQGFSGWKLFNEFVIPTDFLPKTYQYPEGEPKFKFVVSGIDHEITLNSWKTSISTYMGPLLLAKYITKQKSFMGVKLTEEERDERFKEISDNISEGPTENSINVTIQDVWDYKGNATDWDDVHGVFGSSRRKDDLVQRVENKLKENKWEVAKIIIGSKYEPTLNRITSYGTVTLTENLTNPDKHFTTRGSIGNDYERRHDNQINGLLQRLFNAFGGAARNVGTFNILINLPNNSSISYKQSFFAVK